MVKTAIKFMHHMNQYNEISENIIVILDRKEQGIILKEAWEKVHNKTKGLKQDDYRAKYLLKHIVKTDKYCCYV